ncbi:MAG: PHP domain-containing protein, partial [Candidatus Aenigmarchaeota archaeon]|nr:PHP domain-containing protein [Candidatus Aenigmarchaeota archaeon]
MKVDLHIHTKYSKDGEINPEDLVKKAVELGFDAIAVTDHGTIKGAIETKEIARKTAKDLIVFVGQ